MQFLVHYIVYLKPTNESTKSHLTEELLFIVVEKHKLNWRLFPTFLKKENEHVSIREVITCCLNLGILDVKYYAYSLQSTAYVCL